MTSMCRNWEGKRPRVCLSGASFIFQDEAKDGPGDIVSQVLSVPPSFSPGILRKPLRSWANGTSTTSALMTRKGGWTMLGALQVSMKHPASMSSQLVWPTVVPAFVSPGAWAK